MGVFNHAICLIWALICVLSDATFGNPSDFTWKYNGEVNIGVLVNLHHDDLGGSDGCGTINIDAIQQVVAAKWAIDVINNQSLPHELKIGLQVHDTCNSEELTQKHLYHIISNTREAASVLRLKSPTGPPLLGMIGIGEPATLTETTGALHAFNIPLISVTPHPLGPSYSNVLTTAPDMAGQARALANLAYEMNAKSVALISSSRASVHTFLEDATALGIRVPHILELETLNKKSKSSELPQKVEKFLRTLPSKRPVVAVVLEAVEAVAIAEYLKHVKLPSDPTWLVGSLGLDLHKLSAWRTVFHGGLFVEPHMPELAEFKTYFIDALQNSEDQLSDLIHEYKEEMFGCSTEEVSSSPLMRCDTIPEHEIELRFQQDAQVSFVVKAVSALTAAFRLVQLDHCSQSVLASCLRQVHSDLHEDILTNLRKLSFTSMGTSPTEVKGTQHHFTRNGRLVANKQLVFQINQAVGMESIGWYSEDEGLHLSLPLPDKSADDDEFQDILNSEPISSPLVNNILPHDRSLHGRSFEQEGTALLANPLVTNNNNNDLVTITSIDDQESRRKSHRDSGKTIVKPPYEAFISRTWTLVVLAVAILGTCAALWMFIYVLIKMCDKTLTGNQTMGLILLMGVTGLFASVVPWLLPPNEMICTVRHFLHPLIMVLCFAILLVKAMQLRSLVSVGLGGTIPQCNQIVSLIFMLLVQVVINGEWYYTSAPLRVKQNDGYPECDVSEERFLLLHLYPLVLLLLAFFYGISVVKIKRNFNEGRWITCATIFIIPIYAAWSLVYYFAPVQFHDPSVAVSIVAVAGILLSAIFIPKMHTIAHQSKMKSSLDLHRSHSDSTVFTGFSDLNFVPPFPPSKKHQKYYPVYGYGPSFPILPPPPPYHPPPPPPNNGGPNRVALSPSKTASSTMTPYFVSTSHHHPMAQSNGGNFNGLNYVSAVGGSHHHNRRGPGGPRLTSYSEWTHGGHFVGGNGGGAPHQQHYPPQHQHHHHHNNNNNNNRRRHSSSPKRNDLSHKFQGLSSSGLGGRRSKSSSKEHLMSSSAGADHHHHRGRPRKRSNNVNSATSKQPHNNITNPQHYLRIHTSQPNNATTSVGGHPNNNGPSSLVQASQTRSISPSDGMILTASGLRDTLSSENNKNNVVILDGLQDQENVYLAT